MPKVQEYLETKCMQLIVIDSQDHRNRIFNGPMLGNPICLEYINDKKTNTAHFHFIKETTAYLNNSYYCVACNIGHNNNTHRCKNGCIMCNSTTKCAKQQDLVNCDVCSRAFYNIDCYNNHRLNDLCLKLKKCNICDIEYFLNPKKTYECDKTLCKTCGKGYTICPHYCMLKPLKSEDLAEEDSKNKIIVTYDIESTQIRVDKTSRHEPNLLITGKYIL
jgi:hypothetical protein